MHDDIQSVDFQRQGGGVVTNSARTFDLAIRMKNEQVRTAQLGETWLGSWEEAC